MQDIFIKSVMLYSEQNVHCFCSGARIYIFLQFSSRKTYLNIEDRDSGQWLENVNCLEQGSLCEALQHK